MMFSDELSKLAVNFVYTDEDFFTESKKPQAIIHNKKGFSKDYIKRLITLQTELINNNCLVTE